MYPIIRKAVKGDEDVLSQLTFQSKASWGYSVELLEKWREELTITEGYLLHNETLIGEVNHQIAGYYSYFQISPMITKLDNLFINPHHFGKRIGTYLLMDFIVRMKKKQIATITLDADPHAEAFYQKFGFQTSGQLQSSVPGRSLPIMELHLS